MANKKSNKTKSNNTYKKNNDSNISRNTMIMKTLVVLGVIIFCISILYLMNYFFIVHNDIKINMSTDKKLEYINIYGKDTLITTQKYVSDLNYNMRYDIDNFTVFKYHDQDFYKYKDAEKVIIIVEKSKLPNNCIVEDNAKEYSKCTLDIDDFTEENYITLKGNTYKLTVKSPNSNKYEENIKARVDYMLNTFEMRI